MKPPFLRDAPHWIVSRVGKTKAGNLYKRSWRSPLVCFVHVHLQLSSIEYFVIDMLINGKKTPTIKNIKIETIVIQDNLWMKMKRLDPILLGIEYR